MNWTLITITIITGVLFGLWHGSIFAGTFLGALLILWILKDERR